MKNWAKLEPDKYLLVSNYTPKRNGKKVDRILVHHNAGINMSHEGVKAAFVHNRTSAHYNCDAKGTVCQYVYDRDGAWHAGDFDVNMRSFGIEHADKDSDPWLIADKALDAGAHLCAAICKEYKLGRPKWGGNIFPHSDYTATACPGQLKGSQKSHYMRLAQGYYEQMTGETGVDTSSMDLGDLDWWGTKYTKALQTQLGTKADGYLDGQSHENDDYFWAAGSGVWYNWPDWRSTCIIALQKKLDKAGYEVGSSGYDGVYGPDTIKAHQKCLIDHGYSCGECGADGYHGNATNNAMGAALKDGFYKKKW